MAEAAVEENPMSKFFCHKCSVEIPRVLPDYTCPNCYSGFIEEIDSNDPAEEEETPMDMSPPLEMLDHRLGMELTNLLQGVMGNASADGGRLATVRVRTRDGPDTRRPGRYGSVMPRHRNVRIRGRGRAPPIENLIQDFIVNLTGVGFGALGGAGTGPLVFVGNPGDYAWGREGLDAIITQLLNQMDGTGPPPLTKDKIKEIPIVEITQEQVGNSLQCSVCWEDFRLDEPVRKLACEHFYHENCIIPWLELHGTCPICRKTLSDDANDEPQQTSRGTTVNNIVPNLRAFFRAASNSDSDSSLVSTSSSSSSSTSSQSSNASGGSGNTRQSRSPPTRSNFDVDLEFD